MTVFLLFLCLMAGKTFCDENESAVVTVKEGSDAILPCSLSTKENIESKLFDWRKDGQKEVFKYDAGLHDNNGLPGQNKQFKGRVSYFQEELKNGNASIIIRNIKMSDSGDYTCDFPRLQPRQKFNIKLVVVSTPKPNIRILKDTEDGVLLQCEVQGAFPKPNLQWQDSSGNILPAEERQVTERGGSYDVILQTTVTKTGNYSCVATQEEINHQTDAEIYTYINEIQKEWNLTGIFVIAGIVITVILALFLVSLFVWWCLKKKADSKVTGCKNDPTVNCGLTESDPP